MQKVDLLFGELFTEAHKAQQKRKADAKKNPRTDDRKDVAAGRRFTHHRHFSSDVE